MQERVDLAVHPRAERRRRPGPPCDPSVDEVERERERTRASRASRPPTSRSKEARGQRRDADGERRPGERHPACRAEPRCGVAPERAGERGVEDQPRRGSDHPAGAASPTVCASVTRSTSWAPSPASGPEPLAAFLQARPAGPEPPAALLRARTSAGKYRGSRASVWGEPVRQDERASVRRGPAASAGGGLRARRVRRAGELHACGRDPGARGAGRRRARRLRARPVLRSRRAGSVRHPGARLQLRRSRRERERGRHRARTRTRPPVPLRGRAGPAASARHVRRRAPARDHARLPRQGDAGGGGRPARSPSGVASPSRWRRACP